MKNGFYQNINGYKSWRKNGLFHRMNSPSEIWDHRDRLFSVNGLIHRLNGPASSYNNGRNYWFINDLNITEQLHSYCHANNIDIHDYMNLKLSDKLKLKIKFGLQL